MCLGFYRYHKVTKREAVYCLPLWLFGSAELLFNGCLKVFLFARLDVAGAFLEVLIAPLVADEDGVDELAVGGGDE